MIKKIPTWLVATLLILTIILSILAAMILPSLLKESHARTFARTQTEYMQGELKKGTSVSKVIARTQAALTEEMADNEEFTYVVYGIDIDEKARTCKIDVTIADGEKYKNYSSEPLKY